MIQTPDEFMREYERVANSHDLQATLSLVDEEAVYLFSDGSVHVGKGAIERALRRNFELIKDEEYAIDNLSWILNTADAAACVYDYSWSGIVSGEPASGSGRGTSILVRSGDNWRIVHEHLSRGKFAA
jgi:ketosteroid isomerase-like protein